jgi:hypothetical protein
MPPENAAALQVRTITLRLTVHTDPLRRPVSDAIDRAVKVVHPRQFEAYLVETRGHRCTVLHLRQPSRVGAPSLIALPSSMLDRFPRYFALGLGVWVSTPYCLVISAAGSPLLRGLESLDPIVIDRDAPIDAVFLGRVVAGGLVV